MERNYRKTRIGTVISDKMDKTIVVAIKENVKHKLYSKIVKTTYKLKAHDEENVAKIGDKVKNSAYEIIKRKQATYYGIAVSVRRICEVILRDEKSILPISNMMHGEYGIEDIALSFPAIVGKDGVETKVPISLDDEEIEALKNSARLLKDIMKSVDL